MMAFGLGLLYFSFLSIVYCHKISYAGTITSVVLQTVYTCSCTTPIFTYSTKAPAYSSISKAAYPPLSSSTPCNETTETPSTIYYAPSSSLTLYNETAEVPSSTYYVSLSSSTPCEESETLRSTYAPASSSVLVSSSSTSGTSSAVVSTSESSIISPSSPPTASTSPSISTAASETLSSTSAEVVLTSSSNSEVIPTTSTASLTTESASSSTVETSVSWTTSNSANSTITAASSTISNSANGTTSYASFTVSTESSTTEFTSSSTVVSSSSAASSSTTTSFDSCATATGSPIVDLEYALHSGQIYDSPAGNTYFNFSNIRYAAPPVDSLRFEAPENPINNRSAGIQDGSYGKICPQAYTPWQNSKLVTAPPGEAESEDCLFLDVVVSKTTWDNRCAGKKVPVMVWIHGGGYQIGAKWGTPMTNPIGLLDRSFEDAEGALWIGLNYRLGAFGFLQGDKFKTSGGRTNAGFFDQRKAFDWVQKYIELFGGDPDRVTAIGESAGGGSILHHITAYGGAKDPIPIQKAIIQSPAFVQRPYKSQGDGSFNILLDAAGVSSLAELKELSTYDLQVANKLSQNADIYGNFQFGPGPDGDYVPDLPGTLVAQGRFNKNIPILTAHNTYEANRYTDPAATNDTAFFTYMKLYFPEIKQVQLLELAALYPAIYTGSMPYTTPFERLRLALSEFTFTCNAQFTATALGPALLRKSYSYLFSAGTGFHTVDVPYTYYTSDTSAVASTSLAEMLQGYLTSFAQDGDPNKPGLPSFPVYGLTSTQRNLNITDTGNIRDPSATLRCAFWQTFK